MPEAITKCFALDRHRIRQVAEDRFSVAAMVDGYLQVFQQVIARRSLA